MYRGIEHVAIATPDPESLAVWYEKALGFPVVHRYGGNIFVRSSDGGMLELIPSEGERLDAGVKTPGIRHLAIRVDDFNAAVADLNEKGVEIFQKVEAGGNRLAFFRDPEGNILHLIHREKPL